MPLLANGKDIQNQSAFRHISLRGQSLGTDRFDDETKNCGSSGFRLHVPSQAGEEAAL